jgi:apoptosis-inducing factor 3
MGGTSELKGPDFTKGIAFSELAPDVPVLGHADGEGVVVVRVGDDVFAIGASCTHYGGPLAEGLVVDGTIRCPWHHACFDLRTGEAVAAPALADLPCWKVERSGGLVVIRTKREATARKASSALPSVVIVGAGAAGAACAEMLRKEGYDGPITMLGDEAPGPVDRPNLSKDYLAGNAPEEWIPLGTREHWQELRVDLVIGDPVVSLDLQAKTVTTKSNRVISYGALLYATGAEPSRLAIPGADAPHVFTLRTLADARAIIARATSGAKRVAIVGSSFIGLEAAASLATRGLEVHVIGRDAVPLGRILGEDVGRLVQKLHEDKGVRFHNETSPTAIRADAIELADGTKIECELVVLGVGVKPRIALAERAGLSVDGGVVVDEQLRTSAATVWAAGDVAHFPEPWLGGEHVRIEHWVVAERQGQAVARAMLGRGTAYRDVPFFWSAHYDTTISYVGHAPRWDSVEVIGSLEGRDAAIAYRRDGKFLAVATINRDGTSLRVEAAMQSGDASAVDAALRS